MPSKPPIFRPAGQGTPEQSAKAYERDRGSARQRGYTGEWDIATKRYLSEHPLCLGCQAVGLVEPAVLTDHVEPHKGDRAKFWSQANWQPSCRWHHDSVKAQLEVMWLKREIAASELRLDSATAVRLTRLGRP